MIENYREREREQVEETVKKGKESYKKILKKKRNITKKKFIEKRTSLIRT